VRWINTEQTNAVFQPPDGMENCDPLPVTRAHDPDGNPCIISAWELSDDELEEVQRTKRIWLRVAGDGMPPVSIHTDDPFVVEEE
jgi:hypothetical protein